jgi:hypothetical protein
MKDIPNKLKSWWGDWEDQDLFAYSANLPDPKQRTEIIRGVDGQLHQVEIGETVNVKDEVKVCNEWNIKCNRKDIKNLYKIVQMHQEVIDQLVERITKYEHNK